jgi:hypothetical protein
MKKGSTPSYPVSLKLFIDAGNPSSYSGSGTTVTDLVGTQNGTLINGVSYSSLDGGAFVFDGVNDYITFGINTLVQPTAARTMSLWCKFNSSGCLFSDANFNTSLNGVDVWYDGAQWKTEIANNIARQYNNQTLNPIGTWYYYTMSFNGLIYKVYRNGVLINSLIQTITPTNGVRPTIIGNGNDYNYPFSGKVSQMKIYNTQLSDAEVLTDFNEFKSRYGY